jgi:hypothetical protein
MEKYVHLAKELKMVHAMVISPKQISFDIRAILKCRWGCDDYLPENNIRCQTRDTTYRERVEMVKETDYCGIVSGKKVDKAKLFETFYGNLQTAPMIKGCPLNMECKLIKTVDFPNHDVFVGEVVETYCDEQYLTDDIVDFSKIQPILFVMNDRSYWKLRERFAKAWNIGNELKTH